PLRAEPGRPGRPDHGDQVPLEQDLDAGVHLLHPGVVRRDVRPATIEPPHPLRIALRQTTLVPSHPSVPPIRVFRSSSTPSRNSSSSFMALSKASFIASAKIGMSVMSVSLLVPSLPERAGPAPLTPRSPHPPCLLHG